MGRRKGEPLTTIKVKVSTIKDFRDFANGLQGRHDNALRYLLAKVVEDGESPLLAGLRLRSEFEAYDAMNPSDDSPPSA